MGKEVEYKLLATPEQLDAVLSSEEITARLVDAWQETEMKTTYYDTPDRSLSCRRWTLRCRMENGKKVLCLKTLTQDAHVRGEFQIEGRDVDPAGIAALLAAGAPEELQNLCAGGNLFPVCGAQFTRRHGMLRFVDGSTAEIAADRGVLQGTQTQAAFSELELEVYQGAPAETEALVARLCRKFGLREERLSKFARARALD